MGRSCAIRMISSAIFTARFANRRSTGKSRALLPVALLLSVIVPSVSFGQLVTSTWIGSLIGGSGNWSNDLLWTTPPQPGSNVTIEVLLFPPLVTLDVDATVNQLTLGTGATLALANGRTLQLNANSTIDGTLTLNATTGFSELLSGSGTTTLSGSGTIKMSANSNNRIRGAGATDGLINQVTIEGGGSIGDGQMSFKNEGTIIANAPSVPMVIQPNASGVTNAGTLRATSNATLALKSGAFYNSGGTIEALDESKVEISDATIKGGTLQTLGTGSMELSGATLSGVVVNNSANGIIRAVSGINTLFGSYSDAATSQMRIDDGARIVLPAGAGTVTLNGEIFVNSTGSDTVVEIGATGLVIAGAGRLVLSPSASNRVIGAGVGAAVTFGPNLTVQGAGQLGGGTLGLTNQGTIEANRSNPLVIDRTGVLFTNDGTLKASGTGGLVLADATVTNLGTVDVASGSLVDVAGAFTQSGVGSATKLAGGTFSSSTFALQGGSLSGSGTVKGPVAASGAGTIVPGGPGTVGTLAFTSTLNLGPTTGLYFDLGGTAPGTGYDQVAGTTVALDGSLFLAFTHGFQSIVTGADTLTLISTGTALNGTFAALPDGSRLATLDGWGSFQVNYLSNALTLSNFQAIPEPSTYVLLTIGGLGILMAGRRRWRR
jgi:hypothetical protein